jgi:hypothetical protein
MLQIYIGENEENINDEKIFSIKEKINPNIVKEKIINDY